MQTVSRYYSNAFTGIYNCIDFFMFFNFSLLNQLRLESFQTCHLHLFTLYIVAKIGSMVYYGNFISWFSILKWSFLGLKKYLSRRKECSKAFGFLKQPCSWETSAKNGSCCHDPHYIPTLLSTCFKNLQNKIWTKNSQNISRRKIFIACRLSVNHEKKKCRNAAKKVKRTVNFPLSAAIANAKPTAP